MACREETHQRRPAEDTPCLLYLNAIFGIVYNTKGVSEDMATRIALGYRSRKLTVWPERLKGAILPVGLTLVVLVFVGRGRLGMGHD